jgi:hypothetical protein
MAATVKGAPFPCRCRMFGSLLRPSDEGRSPRAGSQARAKAEKDGAEAFWQQLRSIAWCPVQTQPPVAGMPWLHTSEVRAGAA